MGRKATCSNNLSQLALAATTYEATWQNFPGFANHVGILRSEEPNAHWVVPLFPHMSRNDLAKAWTRNDPPEKKFVHLELLVCPSSPPPTTTSDAAHCAYVANGEVLIDIDQGLSMDYLSSNDGATTTLLMSERRRPRSSWNELRKPRNCFQGSFEFPVEDFRLELNSDHGGGVIAAFCDRHVRLIRDDIDPIVYNLLTCPHDADNDDPDAPVLDEADYQ
jgi:hypothetical protein